MKLSSSIDARGYFCHMKEFHASIFFLWTQIRKKYRKAEPLLQFISQLLFQTSENSFFFCAKKINSTPNVTMPNFIESCRGKSPRIESCISLRTGIFYKGKKCMHCTRPPTNKIGCMRHSLV